MVVETLESPCLLSVMPAPPPTLSDGIPSGTGTARDDNIRIRMIVHQAASSIDLFELGVKVNGTTTIFSKTSIQKIQIDGLGGDDKIIVKRVYIKAEIEGGDGNDTVFGGAADDLISGGAG